MGRLLALAAPLAVLLLTSPGVELEAQQAPTFRSGTTTVPLFVTVTDSTKRLVPGLVREDFEVLDNSRPQEITSFDNEPQPISVVLMIDTSASMTLALDLVKAAAEQFLIRLLPGDQGRVGYFAARVEIVTPEFTGNRDQLIRNLKELDFGNPTRLYDGIDRALDALEGVDGRRVVLVFTDGDDTGSEKGRGDVLDRARRRDVMVYAIGMESDYFNGVQRVRTRPDRGLKGLAEETGGGYFELRKTDELNSTFTQVALELHSQYVLAFTPQSPDGKVHKLEVRTKKPGLTARARKSYLAPSPTSGSK
jgi:Ca-activated chloride channel family protein